MKVVVALLLIAGSVLAQSLEDGKAFYRQGKVIEARQVFEALVARNGKDAEARYWTAVACIHRDIHDWDAAVDQMEEVVEMEPNKADYQFILGASYGLKAQNSGVFKQAILAPKIKKAFKRAVELDPSHVDARISLAQYYLMAPGFMGGDDAEGFHQLEEAIKLNERKGRITMASMLERKGKLPEAETQWKALLARDSRDWQANKGFGYFLLRRNRAVDGCSAMQRYVEIRPDTADSYDSYGELLIAAGKNDEALVQLKKALSLDPAFASAHFLTGQAYEKQGKKSQAREAYQKALQYEKRAPVRKEIEKHMKEVS